MGLFSLPTRLTATFLAIVAGSILSLVMPTQQGLAQGGAPNVDLELLLAVDSSSSVSSDEFELQMRGLAEAFRHPAVLAAIQATGDLGIAVTLIQWSDNRNQFIAIDWRKVRDEASIQALSEAIDQSPRFLVGGGTAIGGALLFSLRQFERNAFEGRRKVIDISGDGRTNQGVQPDGVRDQAVARGVTVNGLAILNEDVYVDRYYLYNVIGGTGAFVMTASDYDAFAEAILQKLVKEIAGAPIAQLHSPLPNPMPDPLPVQLGTARTKPLY